MHVVMNDVLEMDVITFDLPATPVTRGMTHSSLAENLGAVFESIGLQLIEYAVMTRQLVRCGDKEMMHFVVAGAMWADRR